MVNRAYPRNAIAEPGLTLVWQLYEPYWLSMNTCQHEQICEVCCSKFLVIKFLRTGQKTVDTAETALADVVCVSARNLRRSFVVAFGKTHFMMDDLCDARRAQIIPTNVVPVSK